LLSSCEKQKPIEIPKTQHPAIKSDTITAKSLLFKQFTPKDGLPSPQVWNTYRDSFGYRWIATNEGIARFDGYHFYNYFSDIKNKIHLNGASYFFEDSEGVLWVLSGAGFLNQFDRNADKFIHKKTPFENGWSEQSTHTILEDSLKNLWFGAYGGLQYWDRQKDTIITYPISKIREPSWQHEEKLRFGKIVKDRRGNFWIGTRKFGLVKFDIASKKYHPYRYDKRFYFKLLSDWITDIIPLEDGTMLISEWDVGIIHFDIENDKIIEIIKVEELLKSSEKVNIRDMFLENDKTLWLGTDSQGLLLLNFVQKKIITQHKTDVSKKQSISGNTVRHINKDDNGNYWVGSNTLEIASPQFFQFNDYFNEKSEPNSLRANAIYGLGNTQNEQVFVSTNQGLSIFDPTQNTFDNSINFNQEIPQTYGVFTAKDSTVWLSYKDKIVHFEPRTKAIIHEYLATQTTDNGVNFLKRACKFLEDNQSQIWTINHWGRVNYINLETHQIGTISEISQDLELDKFVNALGFVEDKKHHQLLVCMDVGLATVDILTKKAVKKKLIFEGIDLSKSLISYIYKDKSEQIWLVVEGVLYQLNTNDFTLKKLEIPAKNQPDNIKWVIEQPKGVYWISNYQGILKYEVSSKKTNLYFTPNLGGINFDNPSPVLESNGRVYFGGYHGLSVFEPSKFIESAQIPKVNIESIKFAKNQKRASVIDSTILLFGKNEVELDYFQNKIILNYVGINHFDPISVKYAYQLEGYDKDWVNVGNIREAIYTNLSPRTYTFKVKASTDNGIWSDEIRLTIEINPPFWQTWWAYVLYLLAISGFIYTYIKFRVNTKLRKIQDLEAIRIGISSNLHDDVGTILSGLAMQSEMLALTTNKAQKEPLLEIRDMSHEAMERMRDTVWAIDSRKDKFENLIDRMRAFTEKSLNLKHIKHNFSIEVEDPKAFISPEVRQNLYLILKEAITNICKHSNATQVRVIFRNQRNNLYLEISDNGTIQKPSNSDGLGLNNMLMRATKIGARLRIDKTNGFRVFVDR
jgi:ligand-binding sensor domain-containing protein/two-component sensor histidine kinase